MVTNASVPGKYKPKKGNTPVATPTTPASDVSAAGNKGDAGGGENATETDEKKPKK